MEFWDSGSAKLLPTFMALHDWVQELTICKLIKIELVRINKYNLIEAVIKRVYNTSILLLLLFWRIPHSESFWELAKYSGFFADE